MHTPITPHGPPCFHNEPTVLKVLNGRNVYVCCRYPNHHCRACCPADVMLVDESRPSASSSPALAAVELPTALALQPFGSPLPESPMEQSQGLPIVGSPELEEAEADGDSSTPDSNALSGGHGKSPRMPSAPSKRSTPNSGTSRMYESGAARSLTPIFNGFAAATTRAQQLGGRFARYRPQAQAIAKMQRQMSSSPSPQQERGLSTSLPAHGSRKRVREEPSPRALAAAPYKSTNTPAGGGNGAALSVQTVSRGPEVRRAWNGNRGGLHKLLQDQQPQNQN